MNKVFIIGRLTDNPVQRQTPSGVSVTNFTVAVNRRFNKDQTDFIPVVTWRGLADTCAKYLVKGQQIAVTGELQTRKYEDNAGNKRTAFEISAEDIEFLAKPSGSGQGSYSGGGGQSSYSEPQQPVGKGKPDNSDIFAQEISDVLMEDEELPF